MAMYEPSRAEIEAACEKLRPKKEAELQALRIKLAEQNEDGPVVYTWPFGAYGRQALGPGKYRKTWK